MHGIIFDQLHEFTTQTYGREAWTAMVARPEAARSTYFVGEEYPDEELEGLLSAASTLTGRSRDELLEDFGHFIVPGLLDLYGVLVDPKWDLLGFLEGIEETIHRVVRLRHPGARPPRLEATRTGPDQVTIVYTSQRKMCFLAKGIIRGLEEHYSESVSVSDTSCMNKGDDICIMIVERL
ncbi:MAG TPA: heme NO-binding domain-containing protein [Actinomycetota bacterium]|nr:heme NO-binding domain-containing protein [Actinomycetota bacterium]